MERVLEALSDQGIHGGIRLGELTGKGDDATTLVVAVTEKRTRTELESYVSIVREVLS